MWDTAMVEADSTVMNTVLKDFTDQKRDEKMYKKVPIFRCTTPSTGKRLGEVVVGTLYYNVPTTTSPNLFPVDGVVHRNIGTFLYIFSSRLWSVKSFKTLSECESRIVGCSPNFAVMNTVEASNQALVGGQGQKQGSSFGQGATFNNCTFHFG